MNKILLLFVRRQSSPHNKNLGSIKSGTLLEHGTRRLFPLWPVLQLPVYDTTLSSRELTHGCACLSWHLEVLGVLSVPELEHPAAGDNQSNHYNVQNCTNCKHDRTTIVKSDCQRATVVVRPV
jgi:hypothetical protein